jgi:hypothetical protein
VRPSNRSSFRSSSRSDPFERFNEGILLRLAGIDVVPLDPDLSGPLQDRPAGELAPVVADDASRFAKEAHQRVQLACHPDARDAGAPIWHRFSRQASSLIARMRSRREAPKVSATKSIDQRSLGRSGTGIGVRLPRAGFRRRRRRRRRKGSIFNYKVAIILNNI